MRQPILLTLLSLALTPLSSYAIDLSDNFKLQVDLTAASDYRTRGISQTLGDPTAQAGATLIHSSGLYAGTWTSNVDFGSNLKTRQELDYYAGYYWQATDNVSLDTRFIKYTYPKEAFLNATETVAILDAYGVQLGAYYSNDLQTPVGKGQNSLYYYLGYKTILPAEIGLLLRYGKMDFKDPMFWSESSTSTDSYREWEVKLTRDLFGVTWGLSYIDTDLSKNQCTSYYGYSDVCSATAVASVSKSF